jgi:hypothetical protein
MHERLRRVLVRLYPRAWRDRYGAEFTALLEDSGGGWRFTLDVLWRGIAMRMRSSNLRLPAMFGLAGLLVATGIAFRLPVQYRASAVARISTPGIPLGELASQVRTAMRRLQGPSSQRILVLPKPGDGVAIHIQSAGDSPAMAFLTTQKTLSRVFEEIRGIRGPQGAHLEVLDPPRLPTRAYRPNRAIVAASGIPAGLLVGVVALFTRRLFRTFRGLIHA